jgi:hypothetical protein
MRKVDCKMIGKRWIGIIFITLMFASACARQSQPTENVVTFLDLTGINISSTQEVITNPQTYTPLPSDTAAPSATATSEQQIAELDPQITSTTAVSPIPTCINRAELIKHLNVSDNTEFKPETYFAKVWLVKNSGSCVWSSEYHLSYLSGDLMGANLEIPLPYSVNPGETVELRVNFQAPLEPATYSNEWMLSDGNSNMFGIGESSNAPLRVQIVVVRPQVPMSL